MDDSNSNSNSNNNPYSTATIDTAAAASTTTTNSLSQAPAQASFRTAIESLLRPSETCTVWAEVKRNGRRRILAILVNNEQQEASLLLLKRLAGKLSSVATLFVLPIHAHFQLSVSQSKPSLEEAAEGVSAAASSSAKNEFNLRLASSAKAHLKLSTSSLDSLQSLLIDLKKFMNLAAQQNRTYSHAWALYYTPYSNQGGLGDELDQSQMNATSLSLTNNNNNTAINDSTETEDANGADLDPNSSTSSSLLTPAPAANPFISNNNNLRLSTITGNKLPSSTSTNAAVAHAQASLQSIKARWIAQELRKKEDKFCEWVGIKIHSVTWNVNGKAPSEPLAPLLSSRAGTGIPDVICIGFQELDLSTEAYLVSDTGKEQEWTRCIFDGLGDKAQEYTKVSSKQLVGMLILIFVKKTLVPHTSEAAAVYCGTGFGGMMGNKGGVAVRLRIHDTYFTFVNSHLAAFANQVERRNQDFADLCRRLQFPVPNKYDSDIANYLQQNPWVCSLLDVDETYARLFAMNATQGAGAPNSLSIFDTDHLIWVGDLNYRIPMPEADTKALIQQGQPGLEQLQQFDQLYNEQKSRRAFMGFTEGPLSFAPTYKFDVGTNSYDSSEKRRAPAWCDRILYFKNPIVATAKTTDGSDDGYVQWLKLVWYGSCMDFLLSDHKPVLAEFEAKTRIVNKEKLSSVHEDISRDLDRFENDALPDLALDNNVLDFGDIKFMQPVTRHVELENQGYVVAKFQFIPKMDEPDFSKSWCDVTPSDGILLPGEKLKIFITINVDKHSAPALNSTKESLDDVLILHTEDSKDHFIAINGRWIYSSFGNDLSVLSRLRKPIREATDDEIKAIVKTKEGGNNDEGDAAGDVGDRVLSVPKELWRMVDFIYKNGMGVENLFFKHGDRSVCQYLRECIDLGMDFDTNLLYEDTLLDTANDPADSVDSPMASSSSSSIAELSQTTAAVGNENNGTSNGNDSQSGLSVAIDAEKEIALDIDLLLSTRSEANSRKSMSAPKIALPPPFSCRGKGRTVVVHSMAETLKLFLESLGLDPVVPYSVHTKCVLEGYHTIVAARQMLAAAPRVHRHTFMYVTAFLREALIVQKTNTSSSLSNNAVGDDKKMTISNEALANLYAPILLRSPLGMKLPSVATASASVSSSPPAKLNESASRGKQAAASSSSGEVSQQMDTYLRKRRMFLMQFLESSGDGL